MHVQQRAMIAFALSILLASSAVANPGSAWQPTIDSAQQAAAEGNRLVMIYFYGDHCPACKVMQRDVLNQQAVVDNLQASYAMVQVNADQARDEAMKYGIVALPTTVITTPDGRMIDKIQGRADAQAFVGRLNQTAAVARQSFAAPPQVATSPPSLPARPSYTPPPVAATVPGAYSPPNHALTTVPSPALSPYTPPSGGYPPPYAASATPPAAPLSDYLPPYAVSPAAVPPPPSTLASTGPAVSMTNQPPGPAAAPLAATPASMTPPAATPPPTTPPAAAITPPLGLDGFCPVQLCENQRWVAGDRRYGLVWRGRTYLFAGPAERDRFDAAPDNYAPMLSGNDIVTAVDQGQSVAGRREYGVFYCKRVYLFTDETALKKFEANAAHYADRALQAMRAGAHPGTVQR